jgi:hypothetical protein
MTGKRFAVYFEGIWNRYNTFPGIQIKGYYAEKQPNYEWSFTEDINKAKLYKTKGGAKERIEHQKICSYRELIGKIIEINFQEVGVISIIGEIPPEDIPKIKDILITKEEEEKEIDSFLTIKL